MFRQSLAAARDLGRLHEITAVLIRYGFGAMVRRLGLANALKVAGQALHWEVSDELIHLDPPARVRRALEELGPTFIKLGQVLATRVDLFDADWIAEFAKLQDSAPVVPYPEIRQQLIEDLQAPPEEVFAAFDPEPLAAASIAQVHRARLKDGSEVVVKVRRPRIRRVVEADLRWLARLAELVETENSELRHFHLQDVVRQFAQSLRRELDFAGECHNAERIAANFADYRDADSVSRSEISEPVILIPRVYWLWTSERVCVLEYIDGISGRNLPAVDRAGLDRKILARRGVRAVFKMIIEDGLFHADPHPGNVFYLPGHRIAFIDFGMAGRVTEERRDQLIRLLLGMFHQQPAQAADVLFEWSQEGAVDEASLTVEIQAFIDQYHGIPLKEIKLGALLTDFMALLRQYHLALPTDMVLIVKAFITLDGMGRELDPDFDMVAELMPMLQRAMQARYAPGALLRRGWQSTEEALSLLGILPGDFLRLLRAVRRGKLAINVNVAHLRRVGDQVDRAASRVAVGLIVAALIVGSSIVITVPAGPSLLGLPFFGLIGFLCAIIGGIWLMLSIWRTRGGEERDR